MAALSKTLRSIEGGLVAFWCPGCDGAHQVRIKASESTPHPCWSWNGNVERPTFSPSILVRGVEMTEKGRIDYEAWAAAGCPSRSDSFESRPSVCHSFVTDGQIAFLSDCTHHLAGQTVPIPDFDKG